MENSKTTNKESFNHWCIFESRLCSFANREVNTFECTAISDNDMPCNKSK